MWQFEFLQMMIRTFCTCSRASKGQYR